MPICEHCFKTFPGARSARYCCLRHREAAKRQRRSERERGLASFTEAIDALDPTPPADPPKPPAPPARLPWDEE
jgi:hypothetical protein